MPTSRQPDGAGGGASTPPTRWWAGGVGAPADPRMADRFLRFLSPDEPQHAFRLIHDTDRTRPAVKLYGTLDQHLQQLLRMNAQGYGVFLVVNRTDGQGQSAQNITRVRAVFTDQDSAGIPDPDTHWADAIVWSSPGRCHLYHRTNPTSVVPALFRPIQAGLARTYGGDPSVTDTPRVMRCPGFIHQKRAPYRSTLWWVDHDAPLWTLAQLRATFPAVAEDLDALERQREERAARAPAPATAPADQEALERKMSEWFARRCAAITHEGRHRLLLDAALQLRHNRLDEPRARQLLLGWRDTLPARADGRMPPDSEVEEAIQWAWDIPPGDPWDVASGIPGGITHEPTAWGTLPEAGTPGLPGEMQARMTARIPSVQHAKPPTLPPHSGHAAMPAFLASSTGQTPILECRHGGTRGIPSSEGTP
jgi:hypothetical protein